MPNTVPSLPVFLRLLDRPVLVAGAGHVASRRVERLLAAGARVTVVAPAAQTRIREWADAGRLTWHARAAVAADVDGQLLVFAITDDGDTNAMLAKASAARNVLLQRADDAAGSDFLVPAVVQRDALQIAISSDGHAPTLARILRTRLDAWIPRAYGDLARLAGEFRDRVKTRLPRQARARFWLRVLDGPIAEKVFSGRMTEARVDLDDALSHPEAGLPTRGEVYLVGGGPGDPDLLTSRALRLMQRADVVLHDSLIAPAILEMANPDAERIHVGKRAARHTLPQEDINALMVRLAGEGKRVLRLKGGDPFVFGRGGEEIAQLAEAGIAFQVVPGITAASGCAAYAGIPLTHRDYAQSVTFVTGHLKAGELELPWGQLAQPGQTVVFFMAVKSLPIICEKLRAHGLAADWPAALVIEGTTVRQRLIVGSLTDLPARVASAVVQGPALLIVGEVVRLNETLGWFRPDSNTDTQA
ncbi:siroheme synthase CysG [Salinisphaera sp.]|uniref:siroheme synthase CysG n=1 Tax=Salinisphaera sp. TaxID=1914330 RepID=UPI000C4DB0C7|nr:siroheme synthase CysG [Salinisphaera sp.]MAS09160.1 uroporphyrinogen-III C-methyltransferase [Salinisphaera sp.]